MGLLREPTTEIPLRSGDVDGDVLADGISRGKYCKGCKSKIWASVPNGVVRFDPSGNKWTAFDPPVYGTEIRHISLLERDGKLQMVVPVYRSSQMGECR